MRALLLSLLLLAPALFAADMARLVTGLMSEENELNGVPFAEVVHAATGKHVIAIQPTNNVDRELIAKIGHALDKVLVRLNAPDSPARAKKRINEVSALFETALQAELSAIEGFECDVPRTASGARQRSGYPDLRLVDKKSSRVLYLDPKLFARGSRSSSFRTFYYEPKRETNKILDDANHLIVGFEPDAEPAGAWTFLSWELVDLAAFRVRLKAGPERR